MGNQFLIAMSMGALAVALIAAVSGILCRNAPANVRNLVWNAALLACAAAPIGWVLGLRVTIPAPVTLGSRVSYPIAPSAPIENRAPASGEDQAMLAVASRNAVSYTAEEIGEIVLLIWLAGMMFFFIRFGRQLLLADRLVRGGKRAMHPQLDTLLTSTKSALGIRIDVAVLESPEIDIPIATGVFHPTILVPADASEWSAETLQIVLLHELAHVRRADILARAAAMIACGLHWFNPVVWVLNALAIRDAELAADDLVLRAGVRASSYADLLLNLADGVFRYSNMQPAMPFAREGMLAERIHAILRESGIRQELGDFARSSVLIGGCAIAMLAACVQFAPLARESAPTAQARPGSTTLAGQTDAEAPTATRPTSKSVGTFEQVAGRRASKRDAAPRTDSSWVAAAIDGLIVALEDSSPQVRGEAAHALGNLRAAKAQQSMKRLVLDPDKFVRYEAQQALPKLDRLH